MLWNSSSQKLHFSLCGEVLGNSKWRIFYNKTSYSRHGNEHFSFMDIKPSLGGDRNGNISMKIEVIYILYNTIILCIFLLPFERTL